jgi:hypothetical protein
MRAKRTFSSPEENVRRGLAPYGEGLRIIYTFFTGVWARHTIFLVPTLFKQFSMLYKIGWVSMGLICYKVSQKWPKVDHLQKKREKMRFFVNKKSTIRVRDSKVRQLLKHFSWRRRWCGCFWSQGHLKVIKGHFKVI